MDPFLSHLKSNAIWILQLEYDSECKCRILIPDITVGADAVTVICYA